jgi:hypothetical protein
VDTHRDYLVDAEVIADANENTEVVPMTERVEEAFGQRPEAVLADGLNATGPNIVELEQRGIEFLSPAAAEETTEGNPAVRADPRQAVPEEAWPKLPISPHTKKLDKSCFEFVPEENVYYCPRGERLPLEKTKPDIRQGQKITLEVYRCSDCAGCPLAGRCISDKSHGGRTVTRDRFTPDRERWDSCATILDTPQSEENIGRLARHKTRPLSADNKATARKLVGGSPVHVLRCLLRCGTFVEQERDRISWY